MQTTRNQARSLTLLNVMKSSVVSVDNRAGAPDCWPATPTPTPTIPHPPFSSVLLVKFSQSCCWELLLSEWLTEHKKREYVIRSQDNPEKWQTPTGQGMKSVLVSKKEVPNCTFKTVKMKTPQAGSGEQGCLSVWLHWLPVHPYYSQCIQHILCTYTSTKILALILPVINTTLDIYILAQRS